MKNQFIAAAAGMAMRGAADIRGPEFASQPDLRDLLEEAIASTIENYTPDETEWAFVKDQYLYDVYLQVREAEGTITSHDLSRKGLSRAHFSSDEDWHAHSARTTASNIKQAEKTCRDCGIKQPASAFKSGAICKKCAARRYRANVKARTK